MKNNAISQIATHIRNIDKDRFFVSLFAPKKHHHDLMVLYAFHHELVKIPFAVNESMAGKIRFQWWWDVVHKRADNASSHPLGPDLMNIVDGMDVSLFETLIEGREIDLEDKPFQTTDDLNRYLDKTNTCLMQMAAQLCDEGNDEDVLRVWGRAFGIVVLLRNISYDAARGKVLLPYALFPHDHTAVSPHSEALKMAVQTLCDDALEMLKANKKKAKKVKTHVSLFGDLAWLYLKEIKRRDYNVFDARLLKKRPFMAEFKIAFKALTKRRFK